jgi:hypothetical protein
VTVEVAAINAVARYVEALDGRLDLIAASATTP